jgi:hypothetical protein
MNESMRMFPVASAGIIRITDRPINLAGHSLPAGQPIMFPIWSIHRSPRLWQDPDTFRPERFLGGLGTQSQPTVASLAAAMAPGGDGDSVEGGEGLEEYVDVAADLAADTAAARDQDQQGDNKQARQQQGQKQEQQGQKQEQTELKVRLERECCWVLWPVRLFRSWFRHNSRPCNDCLCCMAVSVLLVALNKTDGLHCQTDRLHLRGLLASVNPSLHPSCLQDPTVDCRGFMPFSIGTRNCVGQALALVELKAVLATLVGTFRFSLHPSMGGFVGVDVSAKQTVTLRPENGLLMTLTPRAGPAAA